MKKSILTAILVISAVFAYGQTSSGPIDLVLLLDTSSGMSSSYDRVNDYTTGAFLSEFLRVGDTFHLIAYSGKPRLDVARRITSRGDIETIVGRILLQYPVESGSDARAAIAFAEQYVASLPSRPKKIVMVGTGGADLSGLVNAAKQRLGSRNTTFDYVQVTPGQPLANLPSSGRSAVARQTTQPAPSTPQPGPGATGTQLNTQPPSRTTQQTPQGSQPSTSSSSQTPGTTTQQTTQGASPTDTRTTSPSSPASTGTSTGTSTGGTGAAGTSGASGTTASGAQDPQRTTSQTDSSGAVSGGTSASGGAVSSETDRSASADSESKQTETTAARTPQKLKTSSGEGWASSIPLIIGFIILALLILFLIIFLASRRLGSRPNRVMAAVSASSKRQETDSDMAPFVDHSKDLASYAAKMKTSQRSTPYTSKPIKTEAAKPAVINPAGPLLLNLFVDDQNTAIGKRNIHSLKSGYSLSVGGGKGDDFYIFLVPMPSHLGEIRRNGSQCSFIPRKPKYFPDLGSNELRDCINKTIRIISDKNYEITFRFEMYEDPLIALNRVLMSINVPG